MRARLSPRGVEAFKRSWRDAVRLRCGVSAQMSSGDARWDVGVGEGRVQGGRVATGRRAVEPAIDFMVRKQDLTGNWG